MKRYAVNWFDDNVDATLRAEARGDYAKAYALRTAYLNEYARLYGQSMGSDNLMRAMRTREHLRRLAQQPPVIYKVEVIADASGKWCGNAMKYEDPQDAILSAIELTGRWTAVRAWRVVDSNGKVIEEKHL